jgi:GTP-binding protein HflX
LIIVDGELRPSQWFYLEKILKVSVFDRTRVILEIFKERADSKEARLQVRLAELHYEKPFVRELIHRARSGEHPGLMAGGEYQVDDYFEMIKKQMKKIRDDLRRIKEERELRRQHRYTSGFYLVSLAGYTNAGKSSLLNLLSKETVTVGGKLFTTLSTTTRRIEQKTLPILLTDTVGFIQNLPTWIIDAFHSTLEEIRVADIILLVADVSDEKNTLENKLRISLNELMEIGVSSEIIIVLNKRDLLQPKDLEEKMNFLSSFRLFNDKSLIAIAVKTKENIDGLIETIYHLLPNVSSLKIILPMSNESQSFLSWLYQTAHVKEITYGDGIKLSLECNSKMREKIIARCLDLGGVIIDQERDDAVLNQ